MCDKQSFREAHAFFKEYPDIPVKILLGNKIDLRHSQGQVTDEEAMVSYTFDF